jgi:hypothetical protein
MIRSHNAAREDRLINSRNQNLFFSRIKRITSPASEPINLSIDGVISDNPTAVATALNTSFAQNFSNQVFPSPPLHLSAPALAPAVNISLADVRRALLQVRPSTYSPDNLPGVFLRNLAFSLTYPVYRIFSSSLNSSTFPSNWKLAHVIPIFKGKGDRCDPKNYALLASRLSFLRFLKVLLNLILLLT